MIREILRLFAYAIGWPIALMLFHWGTGRNDITLEGALTMSAICAGLVVVFMVCAVIAGVAEALLSDRQRAFVRDVWGGAVFFALVTFFFTWDVQLALIATAILTGPVSLIKAMSEWRPARASS